MDLVKHLETKDHSLYSCLHDIRKFCIDSWKDRLLPWFTNHDYRHSEVVITLLGDLLQPFEHHPDFLDEQEIFVLLAAAYLHDIGMQYLKVEDIAIDRLTQNDYNLIRKRHAEESFNIIRKSVEKSVARDDFHLPRIDEAYLSSIAFVSKGHSTDFFDEVVDKFRTRPETPNGKRLRGELLTALLLIADELDLQSKRVDFLETAKFKPSSYSSLHWYKHHYVECVDVKNNSITITLKFPQNAEGYSNLFKELIETKLKEQLAKVNPVLMDASNGTLHLNPDIRFIMQIDDFGTKRPLREEVLAELKKKLKIEAEVSPSLSSITITTCPKPSPIFTGMAKEMKKFKELLGKVNFISIEGLGGFGKTQFAAKCIEVLIPKDKVVWFDCNPDAKLDTLIGISGYEYVLKGDKTELAKYSGFTDLIERDEKVLFLDNFHDISDPSFKAFFKFCENRLSKAKVVLISREHPNVDVLVASIDIKGLKEAAVDFAKKLRDTYYSDAIVSDSDLQSICDKVDGHPLAIQLALQLIRYGESLNDIVATIVKAEDKSAELSHRLLDEIFSHPKSTDQEKKVMLLFSVFRGEVGKKAISSLLDGEDPDATLYKLIDKKMIAGSGERLSTHPLVREFCYKRLENKKEAHLKAAQYLKTLRTDKFDPILEEEIAHHLLSSECFGALADLISEKGEEFILTGNTNSLREMIGKVIAKGIERPTYYVFQGDIATIKGEWNDALVFYDKAFSFTGVTKVTAAAYIKYGEMLYRKGNVKESLKYFEDAVGMCKKNGWKKEEAMGLNDIGLVYKVFGDLPFAECKINEALEIRKEIGDKQGIAISHSNIGNVLHDKGDFDKALEKHKESLAIEKEIGDKQGIATSLGNIGRVLHDKGDLNGALEKYKESLAIKKEIGHKQGIAISLHNIGTIFFDEKKYFSSLKNLLKSTALCAQIDIPDDNTRKYILNIRKYIGLNEFKKLVS